MELKIELFRSLGGLDVKRRRKEEVSDLLSLDRMLSILSAPFKSLVKTRLSSNNPVYFFSHSD